LSIAILIHLLAKYLASSPSSTPPLTSRARTFATPSSLKFNLVFSLITVTVLHGINALKILLILFINYSLAKSLKGSRLSVVMTWVFGVAVLFGNEVYEGWRLGQWFEGLAWIVRCYSLTHKQ
jgi:succinate dehydrogenase/fumarate reductase cytochrome b subunit